MCGRYVTVSSPALLAERFHVTECRVEELEPHYNVAPRADVPVIAERHGERVLDVVRWGLVPFWAKDAKVGDRMINARAETVLTSGAFKRPFERRRCIVPADGFYEWEKLEPTAAAGTGKPKVRKQPWFIRRRDGEPLAFAGLWDIWHDPEVPRDSDAPALRSCTIITTHANDLVAPIHERMPVVLPEAQWDTWLSVDNRDTANLTKLLEPVPSAELEMWPVSTLVNKADNDSPELLIAPGPGSFGVMDHSEYCAAIRREGHALTAAARAAGLDAVVPSCPDWQVADVLGHVGRLHRWVAGIVESGGDAPPDHWSDAEPPPADVRIDWFDAGVDIVADALLGVDPSTAAWSWTDDRTAGFWARRQANETAVHRWDAQLAAGDAQPIDHALAVDGIDEFFGLIPSWRHESRVRGTGESIHLHCTDGEGEWLVRLASDGVLVTRRACEG